MIFAISETSGKISHQCSASLRRYCRNSTLPTNKKQTLQIYSQYTSNMYSWRHTTSSLSWHHHYTRYRCKGIETQDVVHQYVMCSKLLPVMVTASRAPPNLYISRLEFLSVSHQGLTFNGKCLWVRMHNFMSIVYGRVRRHISDIKLELWRHPPSPP